MIAEPSSSNSQRLAKSGAKWAWLGVYFNQPTVEARPAEQFQRGRATLRRLQIHS